MTETNFKSLGRENIVGSCLMIISMAAFAGEDSVIKVLSNELPISQIIFVIGIGGAIGCVCATCGTSILTSFSAPSQCSIGLGSRGSECLPTAGSPSTCAQQHDNGEIRPRER